MVRELVEFYDAACEAALAVPQLLDVNVVGFLGVLIGGFAPNV